MNKTQKLKATIEDISFETTFEKLPLHFHSLVSKLEADPMFAASTTVVTSGNATLFIQLEFVGKKPKAKVTTLFGQDSQTFMERQYK